VFRKDGTPLAAAPASDFGLYAGFADCGLPPVLVPADFQAAGPDSLFASVVVLDRVGGRTSLRVLAGGDATEIVGMDLGEVAVPAPPVLVDRFLVVAYADTAGAAYGVAVLDPFVAHIPEDPGRIDLPLSVPPGPFPPAIGVVPGTGGEDPAWAVTVVGADGRAETVAFRATLEPAGGGGAWPAEPPVLSPVAPGGAFAFDGGFGRRSPAGDWSDGWPRRPTPAVLAGEGGHAPAPLAVFLPGDQKPGSQFLFPARDGRIYAFDARGNPVPGWPLAGPAASAGTPAVGTLGGDALADLVAVGTFDRITGLTGPDGDLTTEAVSSVALWNDVALTDAVWPMWGGGPWRNGSYDGAGRVGPPAVAAGTGLVPGSHLCYPSPLFEGPLKVRGAVRAPARARVFVYNLEGEEVAATGWRQVSGSAPFDIEVDLAGAVSGMYLCRLVVETDGAGADQSVVPFAVVR